MVKFLKLFLLLIVFPVNAYECKIMPFDKTSEGIVSAENVEAKEVKDVNECVQYAQSFLGQKMQGIFNSYPNGILKGKSTGKIPRNNQKLEFKIMGCDFYLENESNTVRGNVLSGKMSSFLHK